MFKTVLVANRGEIACRVFRTLRRLDIRTVAVYSDADRNARHVQEADVAVRLGPTAARDSYLSIDRVLAACKQSGAEAVHPGYGFLAENAEFALALQEAGIVFIGPPVDAVQTMGDKIRAKQTVSVAGVPVVPGCNEAGMSDADLIAAAAEIGFPLLIKPSAGGGGKGMQAVHAAVELAPALAAARRVAQASFGDDTLFLERLIAQPRHIEVQILADTHGNVIHLGERECSLQRRHQKVIEEAPSPAVDAALRDRLGQAAVAVAGTVGYTGAGTVEFITSAADPGTFFFMEMNTRLQVEHPVTELITGVDLVEQQLRVAAGEALQITQDSVVLTGHAVEARVYAEDPSHGFLPTGGTASLVREPAGEGVRVDSCLVEGGEVGITYDPMLAKVIAWGADRSEALRRLDRALALTTVLGLGTNVAFQRALLAHPDVLSGQLDTDLIERDLADLTAVEVPDDVLAAFAVLRQLEAASRGSGPWDSATGWRPTGPAWTSWDVTVSGEERSVSAHPQGEGELSVRLDGGEPFQVRGALRGRQLALTARGMTTTFLTAAGDPCWLGRDGSTWSVSQRVRKLRAGDTGGHDGGVYSPMPGSVVAVQVAAGDGVKAGQALLVVEAMKMEHTLTAPHDGIVSQLAARVGQQVAVGALLAEVTAGAQAT